MFCSFEIILRIQPKQLQPRKSLRDRSIKSKRPFQPIRAAYHVTYQSTSKETTKKQSSQFVCLRSETWRSIHLHCQFFKLPPLPKFTTKTPYELYEFTAPALCAKVKSWIHGEIFPGKKTHWVLPASSHRPARNVWVENGGKVESCSVGNPFLFGERPMGPIFKGGSFSVRAGKMTKITFYTPEVLQHSPYVSDKYPKGIQDLPSIMFWLGLCLIIFGGSLTIG